MEVSRLFLEDWTLMKYLCNGIEKSIKREVDRFSSEDSTETMNSQVVDEYQYFTNVSVTKSLYLSFKRALKVENSRWFK